MSREHTGENETSSARRRPWMTAFWVVFASVVLVFVARFAMGTDWEAVGKAVSGRSTAVLAGIAVAAAASHALFAMFEVVARRFVSPPLSALRVWLTALSCYALNLNLGALVGGVGMRYALYRRQGVGQGDASRLVASAVIANWSGYVLVVTALLPWAPRFGWSRWLDTPWAWWLAAAVGACLLVAYFVACARGSGFRIRGTSFELPPLKWAALQTGLSAINWLWMGAVMMFCLGSKDIAYADALGALLAAAVAGLITHVPGGWGVIEFVVVALLADRAPAPQLIAGVLVYRAAYYLLPLPAAALLYFLLGRGQQEAGRERSSPDSAPVAPRPSTA